MLDARPLRLSAFRHLAAAYWVNEFGNWIGEVALTLLVYQQTHSPLGSAALFTGLRSIPALLSPLLTTRIEAMRPRSVLTALYLMEAVLYAVIAVITRHFSLSVVLALASLDGCLAVTARALTRAATAAGLVKAGLLREGNGILNLGFMAATAASPVIAGLLVAWRGAEWALVIDAGTFVATAAIILTATGIEIEANAMAGWGGRIRNGFDVLRNRDSVRRLMAATGLTLLLTGIPIPIEVVFVRHTLHSGAWAYGLLLGSWGVGTVIGAATYAVIRNARLMPVIGIGTLLAAAGYGGLAVSPTLAIACVSSVIGGLGNGAAWIAAVTSIQERIPLGTQSAIMSVLETIGQIMPAIGFAIGGLLTAATSPRAAYAVSAVGVVIVVAAIAARPIDRVELSAVDAEEPPHEEESPAARTINVSTWPPTRPPQGTISR